MLQTPEEVVVKEGVGVIVGRFQVTDLTEGHRSLFDSVIARHQKMVCVIGLAEIKASKNNTLNFEARKQMISEIYPEVILVYIKDFHDDKAWSKKLDSLVSTHIPPNSKVTLYGSRDSFTGRYFGRFDTKELIQESFTSGTADRANNAYNVGNSLDWRKGAHWVAQNQYDNCYPTVDVAIMDRKPGAMRLLLARKPGESKFCFVGGFVEPKGTPGQSNFLEANAKREVVEETHLETGDYQYVGSFLVDDWRYRYESSKIVTTLFKATYTYGTPTPDDDIDILRWFEFKDDHSVISRIIRELQPEHLVLMEALVNSEFPDNEICQTKK